MAPGITLGDAEGDTPVIHETSPEALDHVVHGATVNNGLLPTQIPERKLTPAAKKTPQLFSLERTTTVITGAARGLGACLAGAVVEAGGHVACLDILDGPTNTEWTALQESAKQGGVVATYHQCDITEEESLSRVFSAIAQEALSRGCPVTGTIACAGIQQKTPAIEYPKQDFERILSVNVTGAFLTAKYAAKEMIANKIGGSIVMIASMSGNVANRSLTCTAYNSSKAAVQQITRSLAQEWGCHGIRVNSLSPGYIRTAMTDALLTAEPQMEETWMAGALLGRLGAPEDFKAPVVFLLGPGSSFMTGADLRVDGGHCASA